MHEVFFDVFFVYSFLFYQGRLDAIDLQKAVEYVLSCMNFDGGFGCRPGSESHSGQVCCIKWCFFSFCKAFALGIHPLPVSVINQCTVNSVRPARGVCLKTSSVAME